MSRGRRPTNAFGPGYFNIIRRLSPWKETQRRERIRGSILTRGMRGIDEGGSSLFYDPKGSLTILGAKLVETRRKYGSSYRQLGKLFHVSRTTAMRICHRYLHEDDADGG